MKRALIFLIALLVTPALPGVAGAHVEVTPSEAPAGKKVNLALEVGHGCDGAATTSLVVQLPGDATSSAASAVPGWKEDSAASTLKWAGGPLPDHDGKRFPFTTTLYGEKGATEVFKILQGCENGASTAWIQPASEGGAEPEHPASVLTLTSSAVPPSTAEQPATGATGETAPTGDNAVDDLAEATAGDVKKGEDEDDGGGIILPIIGVVLVAASVTAFIVIQRGKKRQP